MSKGLDLIVPQEALLHLLTVGDIPLTLLGRKVWDKSLPPLLYITLALLV